MFPEESNNSRRPGKNTWPCLPACFSVGSDRPGTSTTGSKPKLSWFPSSRFRKKKTVPIEQASAQKTEKPSKDRTRRSRSNAQHLQNNAVIQLHLKNDIHQPHLSRISMQNNTYSKAAPSSQKLDLVGTRSKTSCPSSTEHIHTDISNKILAQTWTLESAAGLWVMVVMLAMIIFFGRALAIICLCFCLYLTPFLRMTEDNDSSSKGVGSKEIDMDSREYKKKVILEGLLERNRQKLSDFLVAMAPIDGK